MRAARRALVWAAVAVAWCATAAVADDFLIDSKVWQGKRQVSRSLTIFYAGRVYDVLTDRQEITIFDPAGGRFVVLDPRRRVKTEISTVEVETFCSSLRNEAARSGSALLKFLASPKFDERIDGDSGELVLESPWMTYRVRTVAATDDDVLRQYREFCCWQARLNTLIDPKPLPPFARIAMQEILAARRELPERVELDIASRLPRPSIGRSPSLVAEHRLQWRVLEEDRRRIEQANEFLATFRGITVAEYRQAIAEDD